MAKKSKKRTFNFWAPEEDKYLVEMKLDGLSAKKIIRSLKKLGYAKRTNSSVNTRCTLLKQEYKVKDYDKLLEKLLGKDKSEQIQESQDPLKKKIDDFYYKTISPYLEKSKNSESKNYNPLEKYLAKDYIVLKINKVEKKLNEEEKAQLEKILEKLESRETKNIKEKINKNKTKNYHYPLPELTPSEIRKKVIDMKKIEATNEEIYEEFSGKRKQSISQYIAHYTRGHYHKRGMI